MFGKAVTSFSSLITSCLQYFVRRTIKINDQCRLWPFINYKLFNLYIIKLIPLNMDLSIFQLRTYLYPCWSYAVNLTIDSYGTVLCHFLSSFQHRKCSYPGDSLKTKTYTTNIVFKHKIAATCSGLDSKSYNILSKLGNPETMKV